MIFADLKSRAVLEENTKKLLKTRVSEKYALN